MLQVMDPLGFLRGFIERVPNYGQEFIRLNRFLQERSAAGIEHTRFVGSPVTPGQDNYRNGRKVDVVFQNIQDNEPISGR